ncbi:MAG: ABC transporter permease [Dehalococcoidales bacterium]|nr:ABC transporter permease [Dehalococcoidales bacterium]
MATYIVRRLIQSFFVVILIGTIVFFFMRLLPGDPILLIVSQRQTTMVTSEQLDMLRHEFGMDRPMVVQYFDWVGDVLRGDFGISIYSHNPVSQEIFKRALISLNVGLAAFIVGNLIGIPLGIIAAVRRGTWLDTVVTIFANIGITVPHFWLGIVLMYVFALALGWLPAVGYTSPFTDLGMNIKKILMPIACLALYPLSGTARQTRSSLLEVMRQDYIRTAWSKGLAERVIVLKHALRNGIIPVVTLAGVSLTHIIGGEVLIEMVFNIPGMGRLLVTSITNQDYPYVQAIILLIAVFVVVINLLVDLAYGHLDPRVRFS